MASSTTMPPPPSPLAHRRTRPSSTAGFSSCVPRKMSLPKADTFHHASSPSTADDPVLSIAHLSKRSTTYTRSSFASWLYSGRDAAADVIADFEQTFSGARGPRPAARRRSARDFEDSLLAKAQQRASSPVDSGIGSSIGSPSEKHLSRTLDKALQLASASTTDSALGDSVSGSVAGVGETLLQDTNATKTTQTDRASQPALKIIRYPIPPTRKNSLPPLSNFARRQIYKYLFAPLLRDSRFDEFKPIVTGTRKNKNLRCLRDIEQSLINQPVTLSVTPPKYRSFGELTVQLVVDTYQHLSESEQRRSTDRAYDNGYFLDLVQQVQQLAAHIGSSDTAVETGEQPTIDDEITLEGGLAESGNLAELVRWKNGEGISLRTGLPYVPMAGLKRSASSSEDAQLSARRKKGVEYPVLHLPCAEPGCDKVFSRQCDLGKHEKTHSRPFKCPEPSCKFHKVGLPTEKELDRHKNDKHNTAPQLYRCRYCEFSTKRESNCKQHMEKKHGWTYNRSKGSAKASNLTPKSTPKTPAVPYPSTEPSPAAQQTPWDNQSGASSVYESPYQQAVNDFSTADEYPAPLFARRGAGMNTYNQPPPFDFNAPVYGNEQLNLNTNMGGNGFDATAYPTPASAVHPRFTPQTPAYSNITPSPMMMMENNVPNYGCNTDMPTPDSTHTHSRHVSNAHDMHAASMDPTFSMDFAFDDMNVDFQVITSNAGAFTHEGAGNATLFPEVNNMATANEYTPEDFAVMDLTNQFEDPFFDDM